MMDLELDGKVVVITGASIGIGLGVSRAFASQGANVVMAARGADRLHAESKRLMADFGVRSIGVSCDVATPAGTNALVKATRDEFGGVDILINNAGGGTNEQIVDAPDEKWNAYWELHVMAAVRLARGFVPMMRERGGGAIIHNASVCADQPLDYEPIYNVTKSALQMFSRCLADQVSGDNIRVNTINAGLILTPDWVRSAKELSMPTGGNYEAYLDDVAQRLNLVKRFASVDELAHFFLFLASPRASFCIGSAYRVDGGQNRTV